MADIELAIKIPEEIRLALINNIQLSPDQQSICNSCIKQAIINGTPLPKGHGRLIDADKIDCYMLPSEKQDKKAWFVHSEEYRNAVLHFNHAMKLLKDNAPTIIEADKGESEDKE